MRFVNLYDGKMGSLTIFQGYKSCCGIVIASRFPLRSEKSDYIHLAFVAIARSTT
jgi:hypothetical protein